MKIRTTGLLLLLVLLQITIPQATIAAETEETFTASVKPYSYRIPDLTVIGSPVWCELHDKDTLLDIARRNGLGYNELDLLYPKMDAWVLPAGKRIVVPTFWVLPPTQCEQLVINIPELRIYFFKKSESTVQTYPIGIGDEGWESPLGTWSITEKRPNPTWYIPQSLQAEYGMASMPPGPDNPLGEYTMKFSAGAYGVHGTSMPWGVGRLVSHGCIRCYPEHIRILYPQVPIGTKLEIIYEPIKLGQMHGQVYVEVHPDVYRKIPDFVQYAAERLARYPLESQVDHSKYLMAVRLQTGVPTNVTRFSSDDNLSKMVDLSQ